MGKLFNVRLSAEDQARVRALREQGVEIAELIRSAIHHAYDLQMQPPRTSEDVRHIIRELNETYPTPAETFPSIDTTHRQEMQEYIRQQLAHKRSQ